MITSFLPIFGYQVRFHIEDDLTAKYNPNCWKIVRFEIIKKKKKPIEKALTYRESVDVF